jgi:hypothetical protein
MRRKALRPKKGVLNGKSRPATGQLSPQGKQCQEKIWEKITGFVSII